MVARLQKLWQFILQAMTRLGAFLRRHWRAALAVIAGVVVLALVGLAAYLRGQGWVWVDWTGFGEYTGTADKDSRGKTLWDWLGLLIIPVVLALGAFWLERSERNNDRKIADERFQQERKLAEQRRQDDQDKAKDQQRETELQTYIDKMTELLLDSRHPLRYSSPKDEVRDVARTRTLTTLRRLDPVRKGVLLRFLYEAKLITPDLAIERPEDGIKITSAKLISVVDLRGADLSEAHLEFADLGRACLHSVNLRKANLYGAHIDGAILRNAFIGEANLVGADLSRADLSHADLTGADLVGAEFSGANLRKAKISEEQLSSAAFFLDTIMPDGMKFDPDIHGFWKGLDTESNEQNGEG